MRQDWVSSWHGWQNVSQLLENCIDDSVTEYLASQTIQDFARISVQNVNVVAKSDDARRTELTQGGKYIGVGIVHGHNECCSDSLLQLLARHDLVSKRFQKDGAARGAVRRQ